MARKRQKCDVCGKKLGDTFTRVQIMVNIEGDDEAMEQTDCCHRCDFIITGTPDATG
jgi:hypothetical protein